MSASSETVRKGPRLVAMELEDEGYGFHMYTNKQLSGQYVKSISDTGAAKRAGLLIGDHVIEVDGINVEKESHAQVVARVREGQRTVLLVIDQEAEAIFKRQGKKITEGSFVDVTYPSAHEKSEDLSLGNMADAWPKGKKRVKTGDWATKTAMFNDL